MQSTLFFCMQVTLSQHHLLNSFATERCWCHCQKPACHRVQDDPFLNLDSVASIYQLSFSMNNLISALLFSSSTHLLIEMSRTSSKVRALQKFSVLFWFTLKHQSVLLGMTCQSVINSADSKSAIIWSSVPHYAHKCITKYRVSILLKST